MVRALWFIFILSVLATTAMWLADNPGQVSVTWHGYFIETSAAVLVSAIAAITVLSALMYRFWIFIRGVPAGISWLLGEGRRRRGYLALSRGMVAVAAGDPAEARRQAGWADDLLEEPSLTMLLYWDCKLLECGTVAKLFLSDSFIFTMLDSLRSRKSILLESPIFSSRLYVLPDNFCMLSFK